MHGFFVSFVTTSVLFITIYRGLHSCWARVAAGQIARRDLPPDYYENLEEESILDIPPICSEKETPVQKEQPEPEFCKPEVVNPSNLKKLRTCVCADGYVRNAWGRCILEKECQVCKNNANEDYNDFCVCAYQCGKPAATKCGKDCQPGCDCVPGFSRSLAGSKCVPITDCPPLCPAYSTFQLCSSGCEPLCRLGPKKDCVASCNVGNCVCMQGYAMESGACYPWDECPKN